MKTNSILVLTGRRHRLSNGQTCNYRMLRKGWALKWPFFETPHFLDMSPFCVEIDIKNLYLKDDCLTLWLKSEVSLCSEPEKIHEAISYFLGKEDSEIIALVQESVEAVIRVEASTIEAREIEAAVLKETIRKTLDSFGLELHTFKIEQMRNEKGDIGLSLPDIFSADLS